MFFHPSITPLSLCRPHLSGKQKKNAAAIATESKGRPGPGCHLCSLLIGRASAERALLPCGWRGRQILRAFPWTQSHLSSPVKADLRRRLRAAVMTHLWLNERKPQRLLLVLATLANEERRNECGTMGNYSEKPAKTSVNGLCFIRSDCNFSSGAEEAGRWWGCRSDLSFQNGLDQFVCLHERNDPITGSNQISVIIGSEK